jgi:hypothetical protein
MKLHSLTVALAAALSIPTSLGAQASFGAPGAPAGLPATKGLQSTAP